MQRDWQAAAKDLLERAWVAAQRLLPTRLLSALAFRVAHIRHKRLKNWMIYTFAARYGVNLREAQFERAENYGDFNAFFTRTLKPGLRPIEPDPYALPCPVDGCVSELGAIENGTLLQAKGRRYTVAALLGGDASQASAFAGGSFCTLYLAPHNYHRVHMPADGLLQAWSYVPGRLFSVNPATVRRLPDLFARNERVCALFGTPRGPLALAMVGALLVGGIQTAWAGRVTPPHTRKGGTYTPFSPVRITRGAEFGRFNMGSTVILLTAAKVAWRDDLYSGAAVRVGEALGRFEPPLFQPRKQG